MKKLYFAGGAKFSNLVLTREFGLGILLCCSRNKILVSGAKFATSEGYIHKGILFVFFTLWFFVFLLLFLDPGIPGVRSMGPSVCPSVRH